MPPSWRHVLLHLPRSVAVALVVAASVGLSVLALVLLTVTLGLGFGGDFPLYLSIAVVIPLVVSAPVSWFVVTLMHEADDARRRAQQLAWQDELTGLLNRRRFAELAVRELEMAHRLQHPLCAAVLDLDHFKQVNDRHGHAAGDAVLRAVAQAILDALRTTDLLGRWGGEEFAIVMPHTAPGQAMEAMQRLMQALQALRVDVGEGVALGCTASIGLATAELSGRERLEDLIGRADVAMYRAKATGRNRVEVDAAPALRVDAETLPA